MRSERRVRARLARLSAVLAAVASCGGPTEVDPTDRTALFDAVWSDFDRSYAFFEHGGIDWAGLGEVYRDSVAAATDTREAVRLVGAMIGRLNDYHADLTTPYATFGPPPIPFEHHFSPDLMRRSYLGGQPRATPTGKVYYARIGTDVGYVYIGSFAGDGWGADIEHALAALDGVGALVIDIRDNVGGNENVARDVAARLYDQPRVYRLARFRNGPRHGDFAPAVATSLAPVGARRFSGPVALITNRFNGSAAEDFTLMLRALPRVTTVGDTTLGLGSNPLIRELGGGWSYRIPQSMQSTPEGFVYQWRGLPPEVAVPWEAQDTIEARDPYVEAALKELRSAAPQR